MRRTTASDDPIASKLFLMDNLIQNVSHRKLECEKSNCGPRCK